MLKAPSPWNIQPRSASIGMRDPDAFSRQSLLQRAGPFAHRIGFSFNVSAVVSLEDDSACMVHCGRARMCQRAKVVCVRESRSCTRGLESRDAPNAAMLLKCRFGVPSVRVPNQAPGGARNADACRAVVHVE